MLGLKRILLIDSFIAGKRLPLMVDGHATINGRNGSGKSSLLKLLQIFYGAEPRQVENRAGGKQSFVDWYLPRDSSLIIFEYERIDDSCCVVIYRHPTSGIAKPAYRFMKGGFTPNRFSIGDSDGELEFLRGKELRAHWQAMEIPFSKQVEIVTDYRAIIQNDVLLLRRSTTAAENKRLAREYCLGDGLGSMQHIEKVCTAIQNQHGNLDRMKDMLADIMLRGGVVIPDPPKHPENIGLSAKVRWLSSFDKKLPRIRETLMEHENLLTTESRIASIRTALNKLEGDLSAQIEILDQNHTDKNSEIKAARARWEDDLTKLNETKIKCKAGAEHAEREINNLYTQQDDFENQNIQSKIGEYEDLERLLGLAGQAADRMAMLEENVAAQRQPFEKQERNLTSRHNQAISKLRDRRDTIRESLEKLAEMYRDKAEKLAQRKEQVLEEKQRSAEPEKDGLVRALAKAEERSSLGIRNEEEILLLENIDQQIARLRTEAGDNAAKLRNARTETQEVRTLLDETIEDIRRHKKHSATLETEVERFQNMLYPDDHSWLAQLKREDPEWLQDIGRIANPELFNRQDLSPVFSESKNNVFGWELDLAVINPADAASSDAELRARLAEAEEAVNSAEQKLERLEKNAKEKRGLHKDAVARLNKLSSNQRLHEQKIASQESLKTAETERVNDTVAQRRQDAKELARDLKNQLEVFQSDLREEIQRIKQEFFQAAQENHSAEAIEKSRLESQRSDIDKQIEDETSRHKRALKQLWTDFDQLCSDEGIDTASMNAATAEFHSARETVERVQGYRILIGEYRSWLETRWSRLDKYQQRLAESQQALREVEAEIKTGRAHHQERSAVLEQDKKAIESKLYDARGNLNETTQKLDEIGPLPDSTDEESYAGTPAHLINEAAETLALLKKQRHLVSQQILQAESAISASGDEQIIGIWRKSLTELESSLGKDFTEDIDYWRHIPPLLESFVDEILPTIRETLVQTIVGVGQQLADYFHGLKNADRSIHSYSSRISKAIVDSLDVDALSEVNIQLLSTVKQLDFWIRLESFVQEWNEWRQSDYGDLPSNELIEAMADALLILDKVRFGNDLRSLFSLSLELRENGRLAVIRNDNDLANASSRGLSYLALCGIFIGITHYLCKDRQTYIHWPVDELEVIDGNNINRLFGMLDRAKIIMVAGFPSKDANLLRLFKRHHLIHLKEGIRVINPANTDLLARMQQKSQVVHTEEAANV